ncbi:uncharacterized protein M8220_007313 [Acridotheres tristis]
MGTLSPARVLQRRPRQGPPDVPASGTGSEAPPLTISKDVSSVSQDPRESQGFGSSGLAMLTMDLRNRPKKKVKITYAGHTIELWGLLDTGADNSIVSPDNWPEDWPSRDTPDVVSGTTKTISTKIEQLANLLQKGRLRVVEITGAEPATIHVPMKKDNLDWYLLNSQDLQSALLGASACIHTGSIMPRHLQWLKEWDWIARPLRSEQPIQEGITAFTDAGKRSRKAAVTWKEGPQWKHQIVEATSEDSLQTLELLAVVWALEKLQGPLNVVTDSYYVAGVAQRIENASIKEVQNKRLYELLLQLKRAVKARTEPYCILHIRSHKWDIGLGEGNAKADKLDRLPPSDQARVQQKLTLTVPKYLKELAKYIPSNDHFITCGVVVVKVNTYGYQIGDQQWKRKPKSRMSPQCPQCVPSLFSSGRLGSIGDGAFAGLGALEFLFIEDSQLGSIAPTALRGLRGLLFLSLANNRLESLPRGLFQELGTLTQLDLRGNPLRCDCRLRWLLAWLATRPSPTPPEAGGRCRAPLPHLGTPLALLSPRQLQCQRHELRPFQSLPFSSLGAEPFVLGGHPGVALAQPVAGACALLEWDQLGGRFRALSVINSSSPVACHPIPMGDTLLLVVAQLGGGSWVWRRSGGPGSSFVLHQALGSAHLRRPHAVTAAHLGGHLYLGVADSSKGGTSTVFRWASGGFYPHQRLRPWHRDTHLEFLELGGRAALVVCGAARRPLVYRWSGSAFAPHTDIPHAADAYAAKHFRAKGGVYLCLTRFLGDAKVRIWGGYGVIGLWGHGAFAPHTDIPHAADAYAAKHFRAKGGVYLCLTRFLGDAKRDPITPQLPHTCPVCRSQVMRWEGSMFRELQQVPARGSLVFQPLVLAGHRLALLGNDFAPSRVFRLGPGGRLEPGQDLALPSPRAFVALSAGQRHFLLATSFKGATQIYVHVTEDVGT